MVNQLGYYTEELKELKNNVNKCDGFNTLNYLEFFLKEANMHMAGISTEIEN